MSHPAPPGAEVRDQDGAEHTPGCRGLVVFLNGTSSSGKSGIAVGLLEILDEPYASATRADGSATRPSAAGRKSCSGCW